MITDDRWTERIRDPKAECMSRDERAALQGEKLRDLVKRVYGVVPFYTEKMKTTVHQMRNESNKK